MGDDQRPEGEVVATLVHRRGDGAEHPAVGGEDERRGQARQRAAEEADGGDLDVVGDDDGAEQRRIGQAVDLATGELVEARGGDERAAQVRAQVDGQPPGDRPDGQQGEADQDVGAARPEGARDAEQEAAHEVARMHGRRPEQHRVGAGAEVVEEDRDVLVGEVAARDGQVAGGVAVQRAEALELGRRDVAEPAAAAVSQQRLELLPALPPGGDEGVDGHRDPRALSWR